MRPFRLPIYIRIATEDFYEHRVLGQFGQRLFHERVFAMAEDVHEEVILPCLLLAGTRFDLGHVDLELLEGRDRIVQRADMVLHREHDGRLVAAGPTGILAPDHEKTRHILA